MFNRIAVVVAVALGLATQAHAQTLDLTAKDLSAPPPVQSAPSDDFLSFFTAGTTALPTGAERMWLAADYLFGWVRSVGTPPLVTTNPPGTPQADAGKLGKDEAFPIFGDTNLGGDMRPGFQISGGGWIDADHTLGLEASFFMLGNFDSSFAANSTTTPILARPFFNITTGLQDAQLIAFPGQSTGSVSAFLRTDYFYGANVDLKEVVLTENGFRLESLLGFRYLRFGDSLGVDTSTVAENVPFVTAGTQFDTSDRFTATNKFYGVDFGLRAEFDADPFSVELETKLAVGNTHRSVGIAGLTRIITPGQTLPTQDMGGLLAQFGNIGVHESNQYGVVPEGGINFAWDATAHLRLHVGYSFTYWTDVARASNQVSTILNPALFPPATSTAPPINPIFQLQRSDIWVQYANFGLEVRF
jgi:Putative beta barrel porin-7 (BBP7)